MSLFDDTYRTIAAPAEGVFKDKGSKFIAYAFPLRTEQEAKDRVAAVRAEHPKARHHCWAYRLTPDRSVYRINDDGEPSGTAGRPILNVLLGADLTNVLVVVVRYFGGTLLGVPGLINAYKTATQEAVAVATIIEQTVNDGYGIHVDYERLNDVMRIIKEEELIVREQQYDTRCYLIVEIRQRQVERVLGRLTHVQGAAVNYLYTN
mgnify:CR=1 FL=1